MGVRVTIECDSEDELREVVAEAAARIEREYRALGRVTMGSTLTVWRNQTLEEIGTMRVELTPE